MFTPTMCHMSDVRCHIQAKNLGFIFFGQSQDIPIVVEKILYKVFIPLRPTNSAMPPGNFEMILSINELDLCDFFKN